MNTDTKVMDQMERMAQAQVIKDARYLANEHLVRSEQLAVLDDIFNENVRDREITELSSHFAPVLREQRPFHLALWGKTGTGKTLTMAYFLNLLARMCRRRQIPWRHVQLDLSTPRPCFRALNELACMLNASKLYRKGISLEELMSRIEASLANYEGYLSILVDEIDNVRRDKDSFLTFLIRRLPQRISAKLILIFVSNHLDWADHLDPRVTSFLNMSEIIFKPYNAEDLQHILKIRVDKALQPGAVEPGVIEKIAAMASHDHGDARRAVALLARSAHQAQKEGSHISLATVDAAAEHIEQDKYIVMIRSAPRQLQAVLAGTIEACRKNGSPVSTGQIYDSYQAFCERKNLRALAGRAFGEILAELDLYSFVRARLESRGRWGRTREVYLNLCDELVSKIYDTILLSIEIDGGAAGKKQR